MSDVGPVSPATQGPHMRAELERPSRPEPEAPRAPGRSADRLELSERARLLAMLRQPQPVRMDLVERLRGEIAADTYETPQRLEAATEALLADLELRP